MNEAKTKHSRQNNALRGNKQVELCFHEVTDITKMRIMSMRSLMKLAYESKVYHPHHLSLYLAHTGQDQTYLHQPKPFVCWVPQKPVIAPLNPSARLVKLQLSKDFETNIVPCCCLEHLQGQLYPGLHIKLSMGPSPFSCSCGGLGQDSYLFIGMVLV